MSAPPSVDVMLDDNAEADRVLQELSANKAAYSLDKLKECRSALEACSDDDYTTNTGRKDISLDLAKMLISSNNKTFIREGKGLLEKLADLNFRSSEVSFLRCVAHYELGEFAELKALLAKFTREEPDNKNATAMLSIYKTKVEREGMTGLLYVGGIAVCGLFIIGGLAWWISRRRESGSGSGSGSAAAALSWKR